jgi:hypothetical protein
MKGESEMDSSTFDSSAHAWDGVERRKAWNCEVCAAFSKKVKEAGRSRDLHGAIGLAVYILSTVVAVGLGFLVFSATGLADAESGILKTVLGTATILWMVGMVRLGLIGD